MKVEVTKETVTITEYDCINTGEFCVNICEFSLPACFDGLTVTAVFNNIPVPVTDGSCVIPSQEKGSVTLGVYAYAENEGNLQLMYSPMPALFFVNNGSYTNEIAVENTPTITEYERFCHSFTEQLTDALSDDIAKKQDTLVSGENIKTLNGESVLGDGDLFIDGKIKTLGEVFRLGKSHFVNGSFETGTGIINSEYWIITPDSVKVSVGDRITIKPSDGVKVWWRIFDTDDLSVATNLKNGGSVTEEVEYISEYDGYFNCQVYKLNGNKIKPDEYDCSIVVDASRISALEKEAKDIKASVEQKQDTLISGENIKTVNGQSILGNGDLFIDGGGAENVVTSANLAVNPKHKPFTTIINDCRNTSDWTTHAASDCEADTENHIIGSQSIHSASGAMVCTVNTYDMLNNDLVVKFKINEIESGAHLYLNIGSTSTPDSRVVYELARGSSWTTPDDWQEVAIPYTGYSYGAADTIDFSKINDLRFLPSQGAVDWNLQYVGLRPKNLNKGIVTFTFDDGWSSQYTGVKLLAEKGITSTAFCIKEAVESSNYLTLDELKKLVNYYETDVEVHGDPAYDQWTEEDLKTHWNESQQFLRTNGLGEGKHLAYPNGIFPENVVQLAKGYFDSCRTIIPFIPLETYPLEDRYRVRAVSGIGASGVTVDKVKQYIDRAMTSGSWLVLVFHKIGDITGNSMYCSEDDLKTIADYAISSGAYIMNYAEVMESSIVNTNLGNVSEVLDSIIEIQNDLIGGAE